METTLFYVIGGLVYLFALGVRQKLKSTYGKWSQVRSVTGDSGGRVARTILDANRLQSVPVQPVQGTLTDHYDPRRKQLRLARDNFVGNSVAATAVAAYSAQATSQSVRSVAARADRHPLAGRD